MLAEEEDMTDSEPMVRVREPHIHLERPVYKQVDFNRKYARPVERKMLWRRIGDACQRSCSTKGLKKRVMRTIPILGTILEYRREYILGDIVAGLTVGIMHIPMGMGFAVLASLPPIYGLYTSLFPVLIYLLLGTSPHPSIGTMAISSLLVLDVITKELGGKMDSFTGDVNQTFSNGTNIGDDITDIITSEKVAIATSLTLVAGLIQAAIGIFRLGFLMNYLSDAFISGFFAAGVMIVQTSQVKFLLGIHPKSHGGMLSFIYAWYEIAKNIPKVNVATLIISLLAITVMILVRLCINERFKEKLRVPIPIELIVVVLGTVISHFAKLDENYGVKIIGRIPKGFPEPTVPPIGKMVNYIPDAFGAAIIQFVTSFGMVKFFDRKANKPSDANQEFFACGVASIFASFFQCFPNAVAPPRSLIHEATGGKTQLAFVVSSGVVVAVLLAIGPLFRALPLSILAAMICASTISLYRCFLDGRMYWKINKYDFSIWMVSYLATLFLSMDMGIYLGVGFSLLTVVARTQLPKSYTLSAVADTGIYVHGERYSETEQNERIITFHYDSPLYFANVENFKMNLYQKAGSPMKILKRLMKLTDLAATQDPVEVTQNSDPETIVGIHDTGSTDTQFVIIDCSAMSFIDSAAVNALNLLCSDYERVAITVYLCNCNQGVLDILEGTGFFSHFPDAVYVTLLDAIQAAKSRSLIPAPT